MKGRIVFYDDDKPKMNDAIEEARRTLRSFFDAFLNPKPNQTTFLLKVEFSEGNQVEHIWVADIDASLFPIQGTIANRPNLESIRFKQRVEFHPSKISDWMYIEDGYLVGGFTTKVIRQGLTAEERVKYDANAPYKFRD